MNSATLTTRDLAALERSFITSELAAQAGLFRVDTIDDARLVGRDGARGDYAGIVFPNVWAGETAPREYRLRRDHPDLEQQPDGTIKEKAKYLSPPGRGNMLYFAPGTLPEHLADASLPVVITEGEKKTLALYRLAHDKTEGSPPRFLAVGVSGVWNWRGTVGKTHDEKGARRDVKGVIADFDRIAWQGRIVHIIYDANVATNESVSAARRELSKELKRRGAKVRLVDLPQEAGINGIDDLLAAHGADYALSLIEAAPDEGVGAQSDRKTSQASRLVAFASSVEFFHTPEGKAFASVPVGEHIENVSIKSGAFRDWLIREYRRTDGTTPGAQPVQDALNDLAGRARYDSPECEAHARLAEHDGAIYLDLCNVDWQAVRITSEGCSILESKVLPVKFRRTRGMLALPLPQHGGSLGELRRFINVRAEDWVLVAAWLVAAMRPGRPFPVLTLNGEQGSAKSTTARILRALVDPNKAALRSVQRDVRELMIAATNGWLVALDNLSSIRAWLSDAVCRLSTGGGFAVRENYSDDDEVLFDAMRPVLLNGIEELATRSDLLDRAIIVTLPTITEERRREEADLWREFDEARPRLLGSLLTAVSTALRNLPHVRLDRLPRMADFARFAVAAEPALDCTPGAFLTTYKHNRMSANDLALEASPVATVLLAFVDEVETWRGTARELLKELNERAGDMTGAEGWAKSAQSLGGILKRLAPNIRASGVDVKTGVRVPGSGKRLVILEKPRKTSSHSSQSSQAAYSQAEKCDNDCHERDNDGEPLSQSNPNENGHCDGCDECDNDLHSFSNADELGDEAAELAAQFEYYGASREEADASARRMFEDVSF